MEAQAAAEKSGGAPAWVLGLVPLALIVVAIGLFAALDGPGLGERNGPPVEELAIERTVLRPGEIELTVRNDGPDAVDLDADGEEMPFDIDTLWHNSFDDILGNEGDVLTANLEPAVVAASTGAARRSPSTRSRIASPNMPP